MALNLPAEAAQLLEREHVMNLATQGSEGPWAAAVFYVRSGDDLVFVSSPASRHASNFTLQPRCAATIQPPAQDWSGIQGIQLEGDVTQLQGAERERAKQRYGERFPFVRPGVAPAAIAQALAHVRWYQLRIVRLYFIDNRRGLGQRQEFEA